MKALAVDREDELRFRDLPAIDGGRTGGRRGSSDRPRQTVVP
jgi:hypothetical protein